MSKKQRPYFALIHYSLQWIFFADRFCETFVWESQIKTTKRIPQKLSPKNVKLQISASFFKEWHYLIKYYEQVNISKCPFGLWLIVKCPWPSTWIKQVSSQSTLIDFCPVYSEFLTWNLLTKTFHILQWSYNAKLRIARNFLKTRENIKISTHSFYHMNLGWFSWEWSQKKFFFSEKKIQNGRLKKSSFFIIANSRNFFAKISEIGPWVSRIEWCEGHRCSSMYMAVRLSDKS